MDQETFQTLLRAKVGTAKFKSWFYGLAYAGRDGAVAILTVPTKYMAQWINAHYLAVVREVARQADRTIADVKVLVASAVPKPIQAQLNLINDPSQSKAAPQYEPPLDEDDESPATPAWHITSRLDPNKTFESFKVELDSNAFAYSACKDVAEGSIIYSPLFITGEVGIGKTHLLHSIGNHMAKQGKRVAYYSATDFLYTFVQSIRQKAGHDLISQIRMADVLLVDDIDFLTGKAVALNEFGDLLDAFLNARRPVVVTSLVSPLDLADFPVHIRERLLGGLLVKLDAAPRSLRREIFIQKLEQAKAEYDDQMVDYVVDRITHIRTLEGAALRIAANQNLLLKKVGVDTVKTILSDLFKVSSMEPTAGKIKETVAAHYNVTVEDIDGRSRARKYVEPRHVALYLMKHHTTLSYPAIGKLFGDRDHTTVMRAIDNITYRYAHDAKLASVVDTLASKIAAR